MGFIACLHLLYLYVGQVRCVLAEGRNVLLHPVILLLLLLVLLADFGLLGLAGDKVFSRVVFLPAAVRVCVLHDLVVAALMDLLPGI